MRYRVHRYYDDEDGERQYDYQGIFFPKELDAMGLLTGTVKDLELDKETMVRCPESNDEWLISRFE